MRIVLKNEHGSFVCCGVRDKGTGRLQAVEGLGTLEKEINSVTFATAAGFSIESTRDMERTITLTADFYADPREVQRLYRIIYNPVEIYIYADGIRRKISGIVARATEADKIIYHRWQAITLQIICPDPYFGDFENTVLPIATHEDKLPNVNDAGTWYISLPTVATVSHASRTIQNFGDVRLYPKICVSGISGLTEDNSYMEITNKANGAKVRLKRAFADDDTVTIDIPRRRILSATDGNITASMSDDTVLGGFCLELGENVIELACSNPSEVPYAEIEYNNKYAAVVI